MSIIIYGTLVLDFAGLPRPAYWLETATNLSLLVNRLLIATNTTDSEGLWQSINSPTANYLVWCYRAIQQ